MTLWQDEREAEMTRLANSSAGTRWAAVRITLGIAQMVGAAVALVLIMSMGLSALALSAVAITCVLTTVSVLMFGSRAPRGDPNNRCTRR